MIRHPTKAGRESIAARFGLIIHPDDQDWEWQVADPARLEEWVMVYEDASLTDDERFSLMEMLLQCVEGRCPPNATAHQIEQMPEWKSVANLLRTNQRLHASSICYWAVFDKDDPEEHFRISLPIRRL